MGDNKNVYDLVMPFTVCQSNGGPYDDAAFVVGWTCGTIDATLKALHDVNSIVQYYVPPELLPQLDLLAMRYGFSMKHEPLNDDEWILVTFCNGDSE